MSTSSSCVKVCVRACTTSVSSSLLPQACLQFCTTKLTQNICLLFVHYTCVVCAVVDARGCALPCAHARARAGVNKCEANACTRSARVALSAGAPRAGLAEAVPVARAYSQRRVQSALAPRARPAPSRDGIALHHHDRSCARRRVARRGMMLRAANRRVGARSTCSTCTGAQSGQTTWPAGPPHSRCLEG